MRLPAALLSLLLLTSCTGGGSPEAGPSPSRTGTASPSAAPRATASPAQPAAVVEVVPSSFTAHFETPSGNIGCQLEFEGHLACEAREHSWPDAPRDGDCRWTRVVLHTGRPADPVSACSQRADDHWPVLAYHHGFEAGRLRCVSLPDGLQCREIGTDHGFTMSRTTLRTTAPTEEPTMHRRVSDPRRLVVSGMFRGYFQMPSKQIFCHLSGEDGADCYGWEKPWDRPADADPCTGQDAGDPTSFISLPGDGGRGRVVGDCWSDFPFGDAQEGPVLEYGGSWRLGDVQCSSERTGVTCTNRRTGHGFFASKARYRVF